MMEEKILTVSVAAYNVENTIEETLDSLVVPGILDKLEVFVVDDGGIDDTLKIARKYEKKYPDTFYAVHKENGGYGSTVNYSIAHATGKYFKLLDGDDWFDTSSLGDFINLLERECADVIITPYVKCGERSGKREIDNICSDMPEGCFAINKVKLNDYFNMHYLTYRTDLIKSIPLKLTEHCFYTDVEYACLPIPHINNVYVWQHPVYLYRTEVAGQSMSISGRRKHYQEHERVFWRLAEEYGEMTRRRLVESGQAEGSGSGRANADIYRERLSYMAETHIRMLCLKEKGQKNFGEIKDFCDAIKHNLPEIKKIAMKKSKFVCILYMTHYAIYPLLCRYYQWKLGWRRKGD